MFFFFKQKTAYEMRISDWSSDVCSSDLLQMALREYPIIGLRDFVPSAMADQSCSLLLRTVFQERPVGLPRRATLGHWRVSSPPLATIASSFAIAPPGFGRHAFCGLETSRSEEHTSALQSLMRHSFAVFCL